MIISDGKARRIAAEWHSGQTCPILSFATTGMIDSRVEDAVDAEIAHLESVPVSIRNGDWASDHRSNLRDLRSLRSYLADRGHRTPVAGWSRIWE